MIISAKHMRGQEKRPTAVVRVHDPQITCPHCESDQHIETSSFKAADYFCMLCRIFFSKEDSHTSFGDALERLHA